MIDVLAEQPGLGVHELRSAMAAKLGGCGRNRTDDCLARLQLSKRIRVEEGARNRKLLYLNTDACK